MLRTNLSTRPFYNERAVHAAAALVAIVVLATIAWQIKRVRDLSQLKTELQASIARDHADADTNTQQAAHLRQGLDQKQLAIVAAAAKEANQLIEQRTFSWTGLFNQLEATLPEDVMLTAVRPDFKKGVTQINLEIQGRRSEDITSFFDRLEKTGAFHNVLWQTVAATDEGLSRMQMTADYSPPEPGATPRPAALTVPPAAPAAPPPGVAAAPAKPVPPAGVKPGVKR